MWVLLLVISAAAGLVCSNSSSSTDYGIDDDIPICIHFSNGQKIVFSPKLDTYSAIQVKGAYALFRNDTNVTFVVQSADSDPSDPTPYLSEGLVASVYSIVITMKDGQVDELNWDNSCNQCSDDCLSLDNEEVCAETAVDNCSTAEDCDPRIYVTWIGTDKDSLALTSAGMRISQFRKYSLYASYKEAKQNF
jgi:hypothetical protein